jgi:hypothetical protein
MSTTTTTKQEDHGRANAVAWVESLIEMVAKLDETEAARLYVDKLSEEQMRGLLIEAGCFDESVAHAADDMRELLRDELETGGVNADDLPGFEFDADAAREEIQESPLSLQVRSGWVSPGETMEAAEFELLLSTGGPALRIRGELNAHREPDRAWLEYQDWGTPWTQYFEVEQETLLAFCRCFYFGD